MLKLSSYLYSNQKNLYLGNTQITTLPKEIGQLTSLEYLDLRNTQITTFLERILKENPTKRITRKQAENMRFCDYGITSFIKRNSLKKNSISLKKILIHPNKKEILQNSYIVRMLLQKI